MIRAIASQRILILALFLLVVSCFSAGQEGDDPHFADLNAEQARQFIETNKANEQFVLLDTRTLAEYEKNHLDNALFLDYSAEDFWEKVEALDKTNIYLVYCHSGGRSGKTVEFMKEKGFEEAHNLSGGIIAWKRAGFPVVKPVEQ